MFGFWNKKTERSYFQWVLCILHVAGAIWTTYENGKICFHYEKKANSRFDIHGVILLIQLILQTVCFFVASLSHVLMMIYTFRHRF